MTRARTSRVVPPLRRDSKSSASDIGGRSTLRPPWLRAVSCTARCPDDSGDRERQLTAESSRCRLG